MQIWSGVKTLFPYFKWKMCWWSDSYQLFEEHRPTTLGEEGKEYQQQPCPTPEEELAISGFLLKIVVWSLQPFVYKPMHIFSVIAIHGNINYGYQHHNYVKEWRKKRTRAWFRLVIYQMVMMVTGSWARVSGRVLLFQRRGCFIFLLEGPNPPLFACLPVWRGHLLIALWTTAQKLSVLARHWLLN